MIVEQEVNFKIPPVFSFLRHPLHVQKVIQSVKSAERTEEEPFRICSLQPNSTDSFVNYSSLTRPEQLLLLLPGKTTVVDGGGRLIIVIQNQRATAERQEMTSQSGVVARINVEVVSAANKVETEYEDSISMHSSRNEEVVTRGRSLSSGTPFR